ncbi:MAG: flagellar filament capping protein FliD [Lachnospiraceae bacterium]|nr:flagellar filament capping protein FliD [Lachnospiraceae bacterium]
MAVRITGLNSGLDTDAIVQELVKSYSGQKEKIEKKQTKLEWKQDAWKELNTKIYSFYSSQLSNLRMTSAYNAKSANISDSSKATVKASNSATIGTQRLEIKETAQAGYLTGSKIKTKTGEAATTQTGLSALGLTKATTLSVEVGGATKKIDISTSDTIQNVVEKFRKAGLNASFDKDAQRFFISSKESGAAGNFKVTAENYSSLAGSELKVGEEYATHMTKASDLGITGEVDLSVKVNGEIQTVKIKPDDEIFKIVGKFESMGLKASFNDDTHKLILTQDEGSDVEFQIQADTNETRDAFNKLGLLTIAQGGQAVRYTSNGNDALSALGLLDEEHGGSAVKLDGKDAKILLNGAEFTSKDGNFSINGLSITALEKTTDAITINTTVDSQGIYDSIKNFFKEYNELIKEMDTLYNADSSKGYEPLTDDEKDEMSDTEIEKWEKKIKDSLLRRDSTLNSVAETLRTALAKSYTVNGKSYNLSTFGIKTQSYLAAGKNEKSLYHIDGDSDDTLTKTQNDKLMAAINSDPEGVADFFSQLVKGAYQALDKKMKSSSLSSAYVVYNDKQMTNELKEYKSKISDWEEKVEYYEDFYYKKFTAMEKAMANLQSSQNSLSMLLGQ